MNDILKSTCLAIYFLAVAGSFGVLPHSITLATQVVAVLLLAGHVLELLVAFNAVKRYPGPLVDSIGLTLLFGVLHWLPLRKRS